MPCLHHYHPQLHAFWFATFLWIITKLAHTLNYGLQIATKKDFTDVHEKQTLASNFFSPLQDLHELHILGCMLFPLFKYMHKGCMAVLCFLPSSQHAWASYWSWLPSVCAFRMHTIAHHFLIAFSSTRLVELSAFAHNLQKLKSLPSMQADCFLLTMKSHKNLIKAIN